MKNISGGRLDVPMFGLVVEDGETVQVPDVQPDGKSPVTWPANRWEPADPPKSEKAPSGKDAA